MSTGRKDMSTPGTLATIHEHLTDDEIVRREEAREKERWKARPEAERIADAQVMANEVAQQEYIAYEIEQRKIREQEAERAIADLEERRRLAEEAERRRLAEKAKRSKQWFGCMGPFGSCAMGVTRKRKPNSKKKRKPNSKKKRKPRATTNKRRNTHRNRRRNTRTGR